MLLFGSARSDEPDTFAALQRISWQDTDSPQPYDEYMQSVAVNQAIVREVLREYADNLIEQAGSYGPALGLLGTAAAGALIDSSMSIGDSRNLELELRDTASEDRSLFLRYRLSWK